MKPKQILDSFSETLIRDERILSAQERALIAGLLHHAKSASGANPETQEAVRSVIASAIGETVAQRGPFRCFLPAQFESEFLPLRRLIG